MSSSFPPDESPTIAHQPRRPFTPDEAVTIARNPSRSLWEAGLVGHREALTQLFARCAPAVYSWMRAQGADPAAATAQTEHFLIRLQTVERPDPEGEEVGRLQDFLLRRMTDYVAAGLPEADPGDVAMKPYFDQAQAERRFLREASRTPDDVFTRRWALGALELTIATLTEEFTNDGRGPLVPYLRQFLSFSGGEELYAQVAEKTDTSVSGLHVAVFKFRQRYREVLRRLVGDTVRNEEDVDSELTKLLVSAS
jgi:RNA polymerase sigma-70 factor (ECF subfamily)